MSASPGRPVSASPRGILQTPPGDDAGPAGRAARKKELTLCLFGHFLRAVEQAEKFEWRAFREALESDLWDEAMKLAGGNNREAAALVGIPYSTFMNRFRPHRRDESGPNPNPRAGR